MPQASQQSPRLTVASEGPLQGKSYPLQLGNQLVGRGGDADVVIDSPNLSRRHAYLSWDGQRLEIQDAGSTNGTSVDGEWIDASRALRGGELLGLGDVVLRVDAPVSDATIQLPMPRREVQFRSEFGTNYGQISQAARDVNVRNWSETHYEQENPMEELFRGRGAGRVLLVLGLIIALSGFAVWMSLIFSGFNGDANTNPFDKHVFGLPIAPVAFGAFALGGLIAGIGGTMSKVARTREREQAFRGGQW